MFKQDKVLLLLLVTLLLLHLKAVICGLTQQPLKCIYVTMMDLQINGYQQALLDNKGLELDCTLMWVHFLDQEILKVILL